MWLCLCLNILYILWFPHLCARWCWCISWIDGACSRQIRDPEWQMIISSYIIYLRMLSIPRGFKWKINISENVPVNARRYWAVAISTVCSVICACAICASVVWCAGRWNRVWPFNQTKNMLIIQSLIVSVWRRISYSFFQRRFSHFNSFLF